MKIVALGTFLLVISLIACQGEQNKDKNLPPASQNKDTIEKAFVQTINGTYTGTLPCGDCDGLITRLTITDTIYSLSSKALGKESIERILTGTFYRDTIKEIITLDANGDHLKFRIMDGQVKKLDKFGIDEQGAPAAAYILKKE